MPKVIIKNANKIVGQERTEKKVLLRENGLNLNGFYQKNDIKKLVLPADEVSHMVLTNIELEDENAKVKADNIELEDKLLKLEMEVNHVKLALKEYCEEILGGNVPDEVIDVLYRSSIPSPMALAEANSLVGPNWKKKYNGGRMK